MILKELEAKLNHQLYDFFYDHEFELLAHKKQFRRSLNTGFQNIIFSLTDHKTEFWLEVNLGVRIHSVENLAQQFLDNLPAFQADSNTTIISIGKLNDDKYFRYKIIDEEDLLLTCIQIQNFLTSYGFTFLDDCSNLSNLDKVFNQKPHEPCKLLYNQNHRCFKGLIIAKLNYNAKFAKLTQSYRFFLEKTGAKPTLVESYEKLVSFLTHYSPN